MKYYVMWIHEDSPPHIREFTKEELTEALAFDGTGSGYNLSGLKWHKDLSDSYSLMQMCHQGIIFKGEIVTPFEKEVVTKYDVK
jgi:hypothetical protein